MEKSVKNEKKDLKMRGKIMRKKILYAILVAFLLITLITVFVSITAFVSITSSGSKPKLSVSSVIDKKLKPGDTITVDVSITEVSDLKGYEYRIKYDTNILNATNITSSNFLSSSPYCVRKSINSTQGVIWVSCMKSFVPGAGTSGNGILETITFQVLGKGSSDLELYKTVLGDHLGNAIDHEVLNGNFENHK